MFSVFDDDVRIGHDVRLVEFLGRRFALLDLWTQHGRPWCLDLCIEEPRPIQICLSFRAHLPPEVSVYLPDWHVLVIDERTCV